MSNLGLERTLNLLCSRFYWPKMVANMDEKIQKCERCVRRKTHPQKATPLVNIQTHRPLELVHFSRERVPREREFIFPERQRELKRGA